MVERNRHDEDEDQAPGDAGQPAELPGQLTIHSAILGRLATPAVEPPRNGLPVPVAYAHPGNRREQEVRAAVQAAQGLVRWRYWHDLFHVLGDR